MKKKKNLVQYVEHGENLCLKKNQGTHRTLVACQHLLPRKAKKGKDVAGMNLAWCNPQLQSFSFIN